MMTYATVSALLATLTGYAYVSSYGSTIRVEVEDFLGFGTDGSETFSDTLDEALIEQVFEALSAWCTSQTTQLYTTFQFDGFTVVWGYTSFDI